MSVRPLCLCISVLWILFAGVSKAVVKDGDLLVRWTFDEGNGTIASDATGGGVNARLSANTLWGVGKSRGGTGSQLGNRIRGCRASPQLAG